MLSDSVESLLSATMYTVMKRIKITFVVVVLQMLLLLLLFKCFV